MKLIKYIHNNKYAIVEYETGGYMMTLPNVPNIKRCVVPVNRELLQQLEQEVNNEE